MNIQVHHNAQDVNRFVTWAFADQLPFVTARAINDSALTAQKVQREHQERVFDLSPAGSRLFRLGIKITQFARRDQRPPEGRLAVSPPRARRPPSDRTSIIARHEDETSRNPFSGSSLAVPTDHVPRNASGSIVKAWRPKQLLRDAQPHGRSGRVLRGRITRFSRKTSSGRRVKGRRAAFLIRKPGGGGTIFERDGPDLVPLYHLVPSVPLDQRLDFIPNVRRAVLDTYQDAFTMRFTQAIRTAR